MRNFHALRILYPRDKCWLARGQEEEEERGRGMVFLFAPAALCGAGEGGRSGWLDSWAPWLQATAADPTCSDTGVYSSHAGLQDTKNDGLHPSQRRR